MSANNNDTLLAVLLLGGAYMMSRRSVATVQPVVPKSGGTNMSSLPGNIGTGVGQALGGALGNMIGSWFKSAPQSNTGGAGANGGDYLGTTESGSSSDWSIPILSGDTDGDWWETIA